MKTVTVLEGFREDLQTFIKEFLELVEQKFDQNDPLLPSFPGDFSQFAITWRKLKFSLTYHGFVHECRMKEFMEELFLFLISLVCPSKEPLIEQAVLIYLLYSYYFKQPTEPKIKIRLQLNHLTSIRSLMNKFLENQIYDPIYCWNKLWAENAVLIVCRSDFFGVTFAKSKSSSGGDRNSLDRELLNDLSEMNDFHRDYVKMKSLVEGEGKEEIQSLDLIGSRNPFEEIQQKLNSLYQQVSSDEDSDRLTEDSDN